MIIAEIGKKHINSIRQLIDVINKLITKSNSSNIVVDSGVFFTNIADGVANKTIAIPQGYILDNVVIRNLNTNDLTAVNVYFGVNSIRIINKGVIGNPLTARQRSVLVSEGHAMLSGSDNASRQAGVPYDPITANYIYINATGNTTNGGMRVWLLCKKIEY